MRRQALLLRQRGEQFAQGAVLLRGERGGELELVLVRELRKLAHQPFSGPGEVQSVQPPIVRIAATLDIAALLELVDVNDDRKTAHAQAF